MADLDKFRAVVRDRRRTVGRSQRQLAVAIGMHPNVLSHKLNGHDRAVLSTPESTRIIMTLAEWGAFADRAAVEQTFRWAGVPTSGPAGPNWQDPPLSQLPLVADVAEPRPEDSSGSPTAVQPRTLPLARLPAAPTALIGRAEQRTLLAEALQTSRLVTLTGVGGTGKTRLATQVAEDVADQYPDGVGFVDLASLRDPALLSTVVAMACGMTPTATEEAEQLLITALADRRLLLVIDNVEQVVEGADVLGRLLTGAPGLSILATSRVPLRLYGEHVFRVPPLKLRGGSDNNPTDSEAVALFVERASAAGFRSIGAPTDLETIAELCAALDGLPLAIELAAAATRRYTPRELLPRIQSGVGVLRDAPRDAPGRHQTLRATLDWSYALLSRPSRRLLSCLSVFAGRFDLPAAAAVSAELNEETLTDLLAELSDNSMLEVSSHLTARFSMLQTVREYASARLAERGEEDVIEQRNLEHYLDRAVAINQLAGPSRAHALTALEAVYPNIRVALDYAIRQGPENSATINAGLRLAAAVAPMWLYRTPVAEGLLYLQRLLAIEPDGLDLAARASAEIRLCALACFGGEYELAATYSRRGVSHFDLIGDQSGVARAMRYDGEASYAVGDLTRAADLFHRSAELARAASDCEVRGHAANMLGQLLRHEQRLDEARSQLSDAIASFDCAGYTGGIGAALESLAEVSRDEADPVRATNLFQASLRIADSIGDTRSLAYIFEGLASLATATGDHTEALRLLALARALRDQLGARLAPIDQARLDQITALSFEATTPEQQRVARTLGHHWSPADEIDTVIDQALPVIAQGSDQELMAWVRSQIERDAVSEHAKHDPVVDRSR